MGTSHSSIWPATPARLPTSHIQQIIGLLPLLVSFHNMKKPLSQGVNRSADLQPLRFWEGVIAYVSLGLLCGCIQLYVVLCPALLYYLYRRSIWAISILILYIILAVHPLSHKPWSAFTNSWLFDLWHKYFAYTWECYAEIEKGKKYIFLEFPHAIFPMGQVLSASVVRTAFPDDIVMGVAADVVFWFPIFRHVLAWTGVRGASRKNIQSILNEGCQCTVLPGGIAEIFLCNQETEDIYFSKRKQIIKLALQEGAHIIPGYFYGNSMLFNSYGAKSGENSWMSWLSRKLRASIVFYYGRHYLPVPIRHPLKMVIGEVVKVEKVQNPSDKEIDDLHYHVMKVVKSMFEDHKPSGESRKLIVH